jgi:phosphatidylglycerophosphate synthase
MLDGRMRRVIDPGLNRGGAWLAARGASANAVTLVGLAFGLSAAAAVAGGGGAALTLALLFANRLLDGLDGAVARARGRTDFGGLLDIVCDFAVYGAMPLAFIYRDVEANALAGAFLLVTFYVNGATFLGYAILAEKRGIVTTAQGVKSLHYSAGLLEGTETIAFFAVLCMFPAVFPLAAWIFGGLCMVTALGRILLAMRVFK